VAVSFWADRLLTRRLYGLLAEREANRLPTIAYVENPMALGQEFTSLFACRFQKACMAKILPVAHTPLIQA
jgi:hypothetical protein